MPREEYDDGTLEDIETWIKREAARLVAEDSLALKFRENIAKLDAERGEIGEAYGRTHSTTLKDRARLVRERSAKIKLAHAEYKKELKAVNAVYAAAKKKHGQKVRAVKTAKAKYNTYCNRFFNAVSTRIFQNMRSICGIQHTWSNPKVKRDIQSGEINKGALPKSKLSDKLEGSPVI